MMDTEHFDPTRAALLVMDVQHGVVARFHGSVDVLLERIAAVIGVARDASVTVVYVRIAFREGAPEVSARNRSLSEIARLAEFGADDGASRIHPAVEPHPRDPVVIKKRVSAFAGSDLEVLLRSLEVETLILSGIATGGVVLSTLRDAADRDYRILVLSDCCLDGDAEVHRVLIEKVFPRQAEVLTGKAFANRLSSSRPIQ